MSSAYLTTEEVQMFFLAAYINIKVKGHWLHGPLISAGAHKQFIDFRYMYWKGDKRVKFNHTSDPIHTRGLHVDHPLSIPAFEQWLKAKEEPQKTEI